MVSGTKLKENIVANFLGKALTMIISIIFVPVYIKVLGIEAYGLVGFYTLVSVLCSLLDFGLSTTITREIARLNPLPENLNRIKCITRTFEVVFWCVGFFVVILFFLSASLISTYWIKTNQLSPQTLKVSIWAIGMSLGCQWPGYIYSGGLMGMQRQVRLNVLNVVTSVVKAGGAFIVIKFISPTIEAFFAWQIIVSLAQSLTLGVALWSCFPNFIRGAKFSLKIFKTVWRFAAGMSIISLQAILVMNIDKIILSKMLSLEDFGYYSLASVIANSLYFIISPIFSAFFPRFSHLVNLDHSSEELKKEFHFGCQLIVLLLFPIGFVLAFFSKEIIFLWTQDVLIANRVFLVVSFLALGTICNGLLNLPYAMQLAFGKTRYTVCFNFVIVALTCLLIFILVPVYGAVGAALSWFVVNLFYVVVALHFIPINFIQAEKWKWYKNDVCLPLLGVVPLLGFFLFKPESLTTMYSLLLLVAATLLCFISVSLLSSVMRNFIVQKLLSKQQKTLN